MIPGAAGLLEEMARNLLPRELEEGRSWGELSEGEERGEESSSTPSTTRTHYTQSNSVNY